ncbi:MAG TPA: nucleotidyltransferase domain-containing protein [Thermodesulfobacteriota bacterium]|nr:nucleotidyltransferase domain-containing protein [Thermodesulfobacteriota bacterium]
MKEIDKILPNIKKALKTIYGDQLLEVILFGSCARGTFTKDSDIDIAVVLKGRVNRTKEIDRIYDTLYELILETGELISIYPVSEEEILNSVWPLYHHIRNEGIRI